MLQFAIVIEHTDKKNAEDSTSAFFNLFTELFYSDELLSGEHLTEVYSLPE
jgi:hypothetical protein